MLLRFIVLLFFVFMMRTLLLLILFLTQMPVWADHRDLAGWVDPRIGSVGLGRTFVGPSMPFGMVKPGPDCLSMPNAG